MCLLLYSNIVCEPEDFNNFSLLKDTFLFRQFELLCLNNSKKNSTTGLRIPALNAKNKRKK